MSGKELRADGNMQMAVTDQNFGWRELEPIHIDNVTS